MNRTFVRLAFAFVLLAALLAAETQGAGKVYRIGVLGTQPSAAWEAFEQGLAEFGYAKDANTRLEYRFAHGKNEAFPRLAAELLRLDVDCLVTAGTPATRAAKEATATIPIVTAAVGTPVRSGLVHSLARPGGNVTGMAGFTPEVSTKHLELLKEVRPATSRIAVLSFPDNPAFDPPFWRLMDASAAAIGVTLRKVAVGGADEFGPAFATMSHEGLDSVVVLPDARFFGQREQLARLALEHDLAAIQMFKGFARAGFLLSYGATVSHLYRRAAYFVDRILKGADPATLPMEQATEFELAVNLKTAKTLGLTIPESVLVRADEVIE